MNDLNSSRCDMRTCSTYHLTLMQERMFFCCLAETLGRVMGVKLAPKHGPARKAPRFWEDSPTSKRPRACSDSTPWSPTKNVHETWWNGRRGKRDKRRRPCLCVELFKSRTTIFGRLGSICNGKRGNSLPSRKSSVNIEN